MILNSAGQETSTELASLPQIITPQGNQLILRHPDSFFEKLYGFQKRLNALAGLPSTREDVVDLVLTATAAEAAEALAELKPDWAWWQQGEVNEAKLKGEFTDIWFFMLTLVEVVERSGYIQGKQNNLTILDAIELDTRIHVAKYTEHVTQRLLDGETSVYNELRTNLIMLLNTSTSANLTIAAIVGMFSLLYGSSKLLMQDDLAIQRAYYEKALVNLTRWFKSGVITEEAKAEANTLYSEIQDADIDLNNAGNLA